MADWGEAEVRGRCGCGRRYRIPHAKPDQVVTCPNCGRGIIVTRADLKAAGAGEMLIPLQPEQVEVREALLVDEVELRPAPAGSGPGLTGRQVHTHEVALLAEALEPSRQIVHGAGAYSPGAPRSQPAAGAPVRPAAFLLDMLASFWFAGRPRNALVLASTALVLTVPLLVLGVAAAPLFYSWQTRRLVEAGRAGWLTRPWLPVVEAYRNRFELAAMLLDPVRRDRGTIEGFLRRALAAVPHGAVWVDDGSTYDQALWLQREEGLRSDVEVLLLAHPLIPQRGANAHALAMRCQWEASPRRWFVVTDQSAAAAFIGHLRPFGWQTRVFPVGHGGRIIELVRTVP